MFFVTPEQRASLVELISDLITLLPAEGDVFCRVDASYIEEIAQSMRSNIQNWGEGPKAGCLCNPPAPKKL